MKRQGNTIVVIDDDPNDLTLIERAFRKNGIKDTIHLLQSGDEAIAYLNGEGKYADRVAFEFPSIVITDLKMPGTDGFGVLKHLNSRPEWSVVPTIMLSASSDTNDIKVAYLEGHVDSYIVKPSSQHALQILIKKLWDYWMEVEVPQILPSGEMKQTSAHGKRTL